VKVNARAKRPATSRFAPFGTLDLGCGCRSPLNGKLALRSTKSHWNSAGEAGSSRLRGLVTEGTAHQIHQLTAGRQA